MSKQLIFLRKTLILFSFVFVIGFLCQCQSSANSDKQEQRFTSKDTLVFQYMNAYLSQLREPKFQLFKTQNMWTFLKLDTETGQIWQVQYSVKGDDYRFETPLDLKKRVSEYDDEPICGRFTLYATDNMYNFILLDQIDGRCWQVQWSTEPSNRGVIRIK